MLTRRSFIVHIQAIARECDDKERFAQEKLRLLQVSKTPIGNRHVQPTFSNTKISPSRVSS